MLGKPKKKKERKYIRAEKTNGIHSSPQLQTARLYCVLILKKLSWALGLDEILETMCTGIYIHNKSPNAYNLKLDPVWVFNPK